MSSLSVSHIPFSPREDASSLYKAFKGFGCDTGKVIGILAHRDATQRAYIQQEYKSLYGEGLERRLRSELSGKLEDAIILWMHGPAERDAIVVKQALAGDVISIATVVEVICSRTPSQIHTIKQLYHSKFGRVLENDLRSHSEGDLRNILLAYVTKVRYEGFEVDRGLVEKDVRDLYKAGERRLGTDEDTFIRVFSERSYAHLSSVSSLYEMMYGSSLEKVVKSETSQLFRVALLTILRCAKNPAYYFAKELRRAMKGMGTNDSKLIRIVVTRTEIDMQYIKVEYYKKYKKTLNAAIQSETSGHYRDFLLSLVGPEHYQIGHKVANILLHSASRRNTPIVRDLQKYSLEEVSTPLILMASHIA